MNEDASTFNITVKCDTSEQREIVLEKIDELIDENIGIVRYKERANVFFSEDGADRWYSGEKLIT